MAVKRIDKNKQIKKEAMPSSDFGNSSEYKAGKMLDYIEDSLWSDINRVQDLRKRYEAELDSVGDVSSETMLLIRTMYNNV